MLVSKSKKKQKWKENGVIKDWIMLIETLLQWYAWLSSEELYVKHVKRAETKHRYIMYLIRRVGKRSKGMGLKLVKFHGILHYVSDMLQFGVPLEFDTETNESGHKETKREALKTQKVEETFDLQTSIRKEEVQMIRLAEQELLGRPLWKYGQHPNSVEVAPDPPVSTTGGAVFRCFFDEHDRPVFQVLTKFSGSQGLTLELALTRFVAELDELVSPLLPKPLEMRTQHTRKGTIFRGHVWFMGDVWRDWVNINWGSWGVIPGRIWGFLDLRDLPPDSRISYGGLGRLEPAVYAIVESTYEEDDEDDYHMSEIFVPIYTEVEERADGLFHDYKFYLADVEAFEDPLAVMPDVEGLANAYFLIKNRRQWRENFVSWLEQPHDDMTDDFSSSDEEEVEEEEEDSDSEPESDVDP